MDQQQLRTLVAETAKAKGAEEFVAPLMGLLEKIAVPHDRLFSAQKRDHKAFAKVAELQREFLSLLDFAQVDVPVAVFIGSRLTERKLTYNRLRQSVPEEDHHAIIQAYSNLIDVIKQKLVDWVAPSEDFPQMHSPPDIKQCSLVKTRDRAMLEEKAKAKGVDYLIQPLWTLIEEINALYENLVTSRRYRMFGRIDHHKREALGIIDVIQKSKAYKFIASKREEWRTTRRQMKNGSVPKEYLKGIDMAFDNLVLACKQEEQEEEKEKNKSPKEPEPKKRRVERVEWVEPFQKPNSSAAVLHLFDEASSDYVKDYKQIYHNNSSNSKVSVQDFWQKYKTVFETTFNLQMSEANFKRPDLKTFIEFPAEQMFERVQWLQNQMK